jgi:hypothetical protein
VQQSIKSIDLLIEDHRAKIKETQYAKSVALLTDIVNPSIIKLTQAEHSKDVTDQGPWSSPEHD